MAQGRAQAGPNTGPPDSKIQTEPVTVVMGTGHFAPVTWGPAVELLLQLLLQAVQAKDSERVCCCGGRGISTVAACRS